MKILAVVCFCGDLPECDPELAAEVLRDAGYEVHQMPPVHSQLGFTHPLDDYLQAVTDGPPGAGYIDRDMTPEAHKAAVATMHKIEALVDRYGGYVSECGPISGEYTPFADMLKAIAEARRP